MKKIYKRKAGHEIGKYLTKMIRRLETVKFLNIFVGIFSFSLVLIFLRIENNTRYMWDSGGYYWFSLNFVQDGRFAITNYPITIRGIIYPLLLHFFNRVAYFIWEDTIYGWWLLISTLSGIFATVFPLAFKNISIKGYIFPIPLILLLIVWRGLFISPLSDLVALYFLVFALIAIKMAYSRKNEKEPLGIYEIVLFFISGALLYAVYNTRAIYLAILPGILLIMFINRQRRMISNIIIISFILFGVFSVGVIQGISNRSNFGEFSILVPSNVARGDGPGHFQEALFYGLVLNFYKGYVPDDAPGAFSYWSSPGNLIARRHNIHLSSSYLEHLNIVRKYPIEMLGSYVRSFLVYINPMWGGGYAFTAGGNSRFFFLVFNYTSIFVVFVYLKRNFFESPLKETLNKIKFLSRDIKTELAFFLVLFLPFLAVIPVHPEERYAISFWLIIYVLLSHVINLKHEFVRYKKLPASYVIAYLLGFGVLVSILTEIYANNIANMLFPLLYFN